MDNHLDTPDFEKMDTISDEIHGLQKKKLLLEVEIGEVEADTVMELRTNEEHFVKGKPLAMNYIKETYLFSGLKGELVEKRRELARVTADLEKSKRSYYLFKQIVDAWRTQSANARSVSY
jgi:hypothetical protein